MANRDYLIGETVTLRVAVNQPGTRKPVDPEDGVILTSLKRDGAPVVVTTTEFTRNETGDYALIVPTDDLDAGIYDFVVTVAGTAGVVLLPDKFTLKAP